MNRLHALVWLTVMTLSGPVAGMGAEEKGGSCVVCHQNFGDDRLGKPVKEFAADIHSARGFGCVACHGGDAADPGMTAMDPAKGYIGKPRGEQLVRACGRCHSDAAFMRQYNPSLRVDQVAEYYTSVHGRRLKERSDAKVATCNNCHPAHSIRPPSDPRSSVHPLHVAETCGACHGNAEYMAPYKIPTDQVAKYKQSVHWKLMSAKGDLSAPTCNDCHGNHGAAPPGISWVGNVCGQCHTQNAELFSASFHATVFVKLGIPGCAACHGNHDVSETSDAMLGLGQGAVCAGCHTTEDKGGQTAVAMRRLIDSTRVEYEKAHEVLSKAEHAGMAVNPALFELNEGKTALVKARAAVHSFKIDPVKQEAAAGLSIAQKAYARGVRALDELQFRRKGLAVSAFIILAVVVGLVLKIREIERPKGG
jgi:predicted CXXCH cytochrome family protein